MSLRGYGATFDEALEDLREAIAAQVSFAIQNGTLDNIWVPAEPHYVELYRRKDLDEWLAQNRVEPVAESGRRPRD